MTQEELIKKLSAPFPLDSLEWKPQTTGITKDGKPWARIVAYVSARAIQDRLDSVFGPGGWHVEYKHIDQGVLCGLSALGGDGTFVTKWDGAEPTDIEPFKGGISSAFKRAASVWGIGRYLYDLPEMWAQFVDRNHTEKRSVKIKEQYFFWRFPTKEELPMWALTENERVKK